MTTIGILGASGGVGRAAVNYLLAMSNMEILAGGREPERALALAGDQKDRLLPRHVNIFDDAALAAFCREADVIVNCTGPSCQVADRVVLGAVRARKPVIDAGGYDPVNKKLNQQEELIREANIPVVINAGLLPGLSGLYPRWVASLDDTPPDKMEVFYAGSDSWTFASAQDIIFSLGDFGVERSPGYIKGGVLVEVPFRKAFRKLELPSPIGEATGFLTYTEEVASLGRDIGVSEIYCHGVNHGPWSKAVLGFAKLCKLYRTEAQLRRSANWLVKASIWDQRRGTVPCFAIHCRLSWANGQSRQAEIVVGDTYETTGMIAGITALMAVQGQLSTGKPVMLHQAVDPSVFLSVFRASAPIISETTPDTLFGDKTLPDVAHV